MIKYLWNGCFLWLIILLNTSCTPPNDQVRQIKEQGKHLEGWWEIVSNSEEQETDPFLNQLFSGTEPNLIQIQKNTIEIPQGISFSPSQYHGHFIDFQYENKKISLQNPQTQSSHQYHLQNKGEQIEWLNTKQEAVLITKKYEWNALPDSTFQIQYISLNQKEDSLAHQENPMQLFMEVYNNRSSNIQQQYLHNPSSNTSKRGKLLPKDYDYLAILMSRVDWTKIEAHYPSNASDLPTIELFIQNKQWKKKVVIEDKHKVPYPLKCVLNYLEKGAEYWQLEVIKRG